VSWPSFSAFVRDRTVHGGSLAVPVRVLWRAYSAYCAEWGFDPAEAREFASWLAAEEGVRIKQGGHGRLRRVAVGIALTQETTDHARHA
jgi:hypothetical protein